jgi:DNA-binding NarL/FixJ family response regulator
MAPGQVFSEKDKNHLVQKLETMISNTVDMKRNNQKEYRTFLDLFFPTTEKYSVVVIDDDEYFNKLLLQSLADYSSNMKILYHAKIKLYSFRSGISFLKSFHNNQFEGTRPVFFIDYFLENNMNATDILKTVKDHGNNRVVVISEKKNDQTAIETMQLGADQFIRKDQFTTFMCTTLLEQFIREDASNY